MASGSPDLLARYSQHTIEMALVPLRTWDRYPAPAPVDIAERDSVSDGRGAGARLVALLRLVADPKRWIEVPAGLE
jgi:hypothetical protein